MAFMKSARVTLASLAVLCLGTIAAPAANAYSPDIDGDGIPNTWEMKGYDADGDGKIDVDFPAMGANPKHKDIFVEMDYMAGLLPSEDEPHHQDLRRPAHAQPRRHHRCEHPPGRR